MPSFGALGKLKKKQHLKPHQLKGIGNRFVYNSLIFGNVTLWEKVKGKLMTLSEVKWSISQMHSPYVLNLER